MRKLHGFPTLINDINKEAKAATIAANMVALDSLLEQVDFAEKQIPSSQVKFYKEIIQCCTAGTRLTRPFIYSDGSNVLSLYKQIIQEYKLGRTIPFIEFMRVMNIAIKKLLDNKKYLVLLELAREGCELAFYCLSEVKFKKETQFFNLIQKSNHLVDSLLCLMTSPEISQENVVGSLKNLSPSHFYSSIYLILEFNQLFETSIEYNEDDDMLSTSDECLQQMELILKKLTDAAYKHGSLLAINFLAKYSKMGLVINGKDILKQSNDVVEEEDNYDYYQHYLKLQFLNNCIFVGNRSLNTLMFLLIAKASRQGDHLLQVVSDPYQKGHLFPDDLIHVSAPKCMRPSYGNNEAEIMVLRKLIYGIPSSFAGITQQLFPVENSAHIL